MIDSPSDLIAVLRYDIIGSADDESVILVQCLNLNAVVNIVVLIRVLSSKTWYNIITYMEFE